jgi:hypothetical protein
MTMRGKRKNYRLNEVIPLDNGDANPELGDANAKGLLRNFVRRGGVPRWGTALNQLDTVRKLKFVGSFQPNEIGNHTVVLTYFDKGADGVWRFFQLQTQEVNVIP